MREELLLYQQARRAVQAICTKEVNCGFFLVKTQSCKELLLGKVAEMQAAIL